MGWVVNDILCRIIIGKDPVPIQGRVVGSQVLSGRVWKVLTPTLFDPRSVKLEASRYTTGLSPARHVRKENLNYIDRYMKGKETRRFLFM